MHDCLDLDHAKEIADEIADHLVQAEPGLPLGGHAIVVRDAENRAVYQPEMDPASITQRRQ